MTMTIRYQFCPIAYDIIIQFRGYIRVGLRDLFKTFLSMFLLFFLDKQNLNKKKKEKEKI